MLFGFGTVSRKTGEAGSKIYKKEQRCPKYLVLSSRRETETERVWDWVGTCSLILFPPYSASYIRIHVFQATGTLGSYCSLTGLMFLFWELVHPKYNLKLLCMQF